VKYFVYILECQGGTLYTGIATDVDRRFKEHLAHKGGGYTRAHKPNRIAYREPAKNRSAALKREYEIKSWPRKAKLELIRSK
jgi:putative endonuclease